MAKHNNPSIAQDAARILNSTGEFLSEEVEGPVAVIPITRVCNIVKYTVRTTTGASTVYTTPSDKDFYLVAVNFSAMKDATCDASISDPARLVVTIDGVAIAVVAIAALTTTASSGVTSLSFPVPIKVDRNTAIQITGAGYTVGTQTRAACIVGYTVETTR